MTHHHPDHPDHPDHHPDPPTFPPIELILIDEHDGTEIRLLKHILRELIAIRRELAPVPPPPPIFTPATSVKIVQIGETMSTIPVPNPTLLSISPGNAPQFEAATQPVNAGPFVPANVAWSVSGDPGASVAQNTADPTGLTATLTLSAAVVIGAVLSLTVVITNQDGSTVTNTDTLTVVPVNTPPPPFVPATGVAIQQFV